MIEVKNDLIDKFRNAADLNNGSKGTFSMKCYEKHKEEIKHFMKEKDLDGSQTAELILTLLKQNSLTGKGDAHIHELSVTRIAFIQSVTKFSEEMITLMNAFENEWLDIRDYVNNTQKDSKKSKNHHEKELLQKEYLINELTNKIGDFKKQIIFLEKESNKGEKIISLREKQLNENEKIVSKMKEQLDLVNNQIISFDTIREKMKQLEIGNKQLEENLKHEKNKNSLLKIQQAKFESKIIAMDENNKEKIDMLHDHYKEILNSEKESLKALYEERIVDLKSHFSN